MNTRIVIYGLQIVYTIIVIVNVKQLVIDQQFIVNRLGNTLEFFFTVSITYNGSYRIKQSQKCCSVLFLLRLCLSCTAAEQKAQQYKTTNQPFHYWAAFAIRAWKPPMAMVTEEARSASVGLVPSSTAIPETSAAVLPVT